MPSIRPKNETARKTSIAGIILAAGESSRFTQIKQLAEFRGKTFIENVVETALNSVLSPIIVVLGANAEEIKPVLIRFQNQIQMVDNLDWKNGQSSSIRVAVNALDNKCDAAIFLLSDQPQVETKLITSLINYYEFNKPSILAPFIGEKRGNPVLFDKICFNQLHHLQGDKGGRALFNEFGLTRLKWEDENILLDVDSPEDYLNLKEKYE